MKIYNTQVVMREFPDEITLALNISGCPNRCPGCHSPHLREDIGVPATDSMVFGLIESNPGITCIGFMGGDGREDDLMHLATRIREYYPDIKIGWYSGRDVLDVHMTTHFDYIKYGSWKEDCGPINVPTTNQHMIRCIHDTPQDTHIEDITAWFWDSDAV